jgi:hypothetical protein
MMVLPPSSSWVGSIRAGPIRRHKATFSKWIPPTEYQKSHNGVNCQPQVKLLKNVSTIGQNAKKDLNFSPYSKNIFQS